jgi:hypothetical protein
MKVAELKTELKRRGLPSTGLKKALLARLQEAVAADSSSSSGLSDADSDGPEVDMDDAACDVDTDYEGYDCSDSSCPCSPSPTRDKRHVSITLWLAADYKFLLVVLGFKGATSKHPCIYCRANLSDPKEWKNPRPLDERKATDPPDVEFSQHCKNLFPYIPRDRCRIDVLHMLLRCMDRFIHYAALVYLRCWAPHLDKDEDKQKALTAGLGKAFAKAAGQGSITFAEKTGSTNTWKLTRVNGSGYKKILENFKFADSLPPENVDTAKMHQDTWDSFNDIYTHVNTTKPWGHERLRDTIRIWFSRCVGGSVDNLPTNEATAHRGISLQKNKPLFLASYLLTPYFHCLLCHVPQMIAFREIYSFTGQNFEKGNHVHQRIHAAASNHIDDNRPVMEQHLRCLMNKVGDEVKRQAATECDSPACSSSFKTKGAWVNHRKRVHEDDVVDETDVATETAFRRAREALMTSLPTAAAASDVSWARDVNNAYDALLAEERETQNKRYKRYRAELLKRQRVVVRSVDEDVDVWKKAESEALNVAMSED